MSAHGYEPPLLLTPEAMAVDLARYNITPVLKPRRTFGAWRRTVKHPADLLDALGRSWSVLTASTQAALALLSGAS